MFLGLKLTIICDLSSRIVGINTSQLSFDTFSPSSTQTTSIPVIDLIEVIFVLSPANVNLEPF